MSAFDPPPTGHLLIMITGMNEAAKNQLNSANGAALLSAGILFALIFAALYASRVFRYDREHMKGASGGGIAVLPVAALAFIVLGIMGLASGR